MNSNRPSKGFPRLLQRHLKKTIRCEKRVIHHALAEFAKAVIVTGKDEE